jgi:hypothetical protein
MKLYTEERIQTILKRLEHEFDDPKCVIQVYITTEAVPPPAPLWEDIPEDIPDDVPAAPVAPPEESPEPPTESLKILRKTRASSTS